MKCLIPCKTCPWRVDQDATTIPGYDHDKAIALLNTVGEGDAFRSIMACHNSSDTNMIPCKGYLAQVGIGNINVRLMAAQDRIPWPSQVQEACEKEGINLEKNYPTVLKKLAASISG